MFYLLLVVGSVAVCAATLRWQALVWLEAALW